MTSRSRENIPGRFKPKGLVKLFPLDNLTLNDSRVPTIFYSFSPTHTYLPLYFLKLWIISGTKEIRGGREGGNGKLKSNYLCLHGACPPLSPHIVLLPGGGQSKKNYFNFPSIAPGGRSNHCEMY
jgi:hypothetical protein